MNPQHIYLEETVFLKLRVNIYLLSIQALLVQHHLPPADFIFNIVGQKLIASRLVEAKFSSKMLKSTILRLHLVDADDVSLRADTR